MRRLSILLPALLPALLSPAAPLSSAIPGDRQLVDYFRDEVTTLSSNCLANIQSREDWEAKRAEYRRQLQEVLNLYPIIQI